MKRKFSYDMVTLMAAICLLAAFASVGFTQQISDPVANPYSGFVRDSERCTGPIWSPKSIKTGDFSAATEGAPVNEYEKDDPIRESLRRAYNGRIIKDNSGTNQYAFPERATSLQEEGSVDGCDCGENCKCPPYVCGKGDCTNNFVAMFSATWCGPCKRMYPIMEKLRLEGYIVYMYTLDVKEFKKMNLDAKFNIKLLPTFIVFDNGVEVKRAVGTNKIEWFRTNLKTRKQQDAEKPDVNPEPENYDL